MISFDEGYAKIAALASRLENETIDLAEANGRVLAEDVVATRDHPASDISAMDGYALSGNHAQYEIIGEVAAGKDLGAKIKSGQAVRIFTGAKIPEGADRVAMQENATVFENSVQISPIPDPQQNIRTQGSDITKWFSVSSPRVLTPSELGLIASLNQSRIQVVKQPHIAIISTGSELVMPGDAVKDTDIVASNAFALKALAENLGARATISPIVSDNLDSIAEAISQQKSADIVLTIGGASVGKFDFVAEAARLSGFKIDVQKVALRPGKPIMAGQKGQQIFLGLPGNPISSMICALIFLRSIVLGQLGLDQSLPEVRSAKIKECLSSNGDRTHFMRAQASIDSSGFFIKAFGNQDSAAISVMAKSNALIVRQPNEPDLKAGDLVQFMMIDDFRI